jgi:hypothetical protein
MRRDVAGEIARDLANRRDDFRLRDGSDRPAPPPLRGISSTARPARRNRLSHILNAKNQSLAMDRSM